MRQDQSYCSKKRNSISNVGTLWQNFKNEVKSKIELIQLWLQRQRFQMATFFLSLQNDLRDENPSIAMKKLIITTEIMSYNTLKEHSTRARKTLMTLTSTAILPNTHCFLCLVVFNILHVETFR